MTQSSFSKFIQKELNTIRSKNRFRTLVRPSGIDFSSNDYLCLSKHPEVVLAFQEGIEKFGAGATASRLLRGHNEIFEILENRFSEFVNSEASLFLANGFIANLGLMDSLAGPDSIVFTDRLNHASILDGIRISGSIKKYFRHLDYNDLEDQLKKSDSRKRKFIVSESVFSMDGDIADIKTLVYLKNKYDACLILDEAHALGVFGKEGGGVVLAESSELARDIDFRIYTGGKSLGIFGSLIACSELSKEYLINKMRGLIFSTAPPPAIAYSLLKSLIILRSKDAERKSLLENAEFTRVQLKKIGLNTIRSNSQIIPVVLGEEGISLHYARVLNENGFDIRAIRPPTVKESRLRLSLNAGIKKIDLENFIDCIRLLKKDAL